MSARTRGLNAAVRARDAIPKYGDAIFIPDGYGHGQWTNACVNSAADGGKHPDGWMLVTCRGHAKSLNVSVPANGHGKHWVWPHECPGGKEFLEANPVSEAISAPESGVNNSYRIGEEGLQ